MNLTDRIGELIDRTCAYCDGVIPESSPSADFCGENCQSWWTSRNNSPVFKTDSPPNAGLMQFASPEQMGRYYDESGQRLQLYHVTTPIPVPHSAILNWFGNPAPRFDDPS